MKYSQTADLKNQLAQVDDFLVILPSQPQIDHLAAGLAFFLSLQQAQKRVSITTEGTIKVSHAHLFGVGEIQNNFPQAGGGNLTLILGGVVDQQTQKPTTLKELTWNPEGSDLKLVFHPLPGQSFEPTHITPKFEGGTFSYIFVIGAQNYEQLGALYTENKSAFENSTVVNIDTNGSNTSFGKINIIDPQASSLSEMMATLLPELGLSLVDDIATNILTGIYESTHSLADSTVTADTFIAVAESIRQGGKRPTQTAEISQGLDLTQAEVTTDPSFIQEVMQPQSVNFSQTDQPTDSPVLTAQPVDDPKPEVEEEKMQEKTSQPESSPEEVPAGEEVSGGNPESDWLTPKIYKGGSLG